MALLFGSVACAAESMPKKDVLVDPAAGEGFCLHSLFQSNMVLQRSKPIAVWGWSTPGDKITVTFAGKTATTTAGEDRSWKVTLPAMEASSQPATMTIEGQDGKIALENILIGDVWVLGGQSNMQWGIGATNEGNLEVVSANFPNIRMLTIPKIFGPELKTNFPRAEQFSLITGEDEYAGDWQVCSPETALTRVPRGSYHFQCNYLKTNVFFQTRQTRITLRDTI